MKTDKPTGPEFVEHCLGMVHDAQKANPHHYSPKDYLLFMKLGHWNLLRIEHCKAPGGLGVEFSANPYHLPHDAQYRGPVYLRKFQDIELVLDDSLEMPQLALKAGRPKHVGQCQ